MVTKDTLKVDLMAGLTGAVIVLPQGIAFAMIAGMPVEYGLYTAMATPIVAALFGSSHHLISGPTTAISIVVFGTISGHAEPGTPEFVNFALTLTFLAGVYQLAFGLARLGTVVNFVSHSVVVGFTAGAAILIATSQMKHLLGIEVPRGESFLHTWVGIFEAAPDANLAAFGIGLLTLVSAILIKRIWPKLPFMLIAMVLGSLVAFFLGAAEHGVKLVGSIEGHLPPPSLPDFSIATIRMLAPEALAVALLGLIEAVSIGRSIGAKSGQNIDGNQEFIGQGLSNLAGSFLSSYAGSGSFTRSGVNYQAGAQTPLSALFAAGLLALILLFVAPLAAYLPIAVMGGLILLVAYNLIDFHHISAIARASRSETVVLGVTFGSTLLLDLEFAIYAGVLLSLVFYLKKTAKPAIHPMAPDPDAPKQRFMDVKPSRLAECGQLKVVRVDGGFFFGAVSYLEYNFDRIRSENPDAKYLLILASGVNIIDVSGAEMLVREVERWRKRGGELFLCGLHKEESKFLGGGGYMEAICEDQLYKSKADAIREIYARLDKDKCNSCQKRIFQECRSSATRGVTLAAQ